MISVNPLSPRHLPDINLKYFAAPNCLMNISSYIISDPKICHGKPVFKGTRIMVWQVLEMLEAGATTRDIVESYPSLTAAHVKAALHVAAERLAGEQRVLFS